MRLLQTAAAVLFVLFVAGCASPPPPAAPAGSATPWMTAAGCDAIIARRMGKSC
jgi:hypothetical protein